MKLNGKIFASVILCAVLLASSGCGKNDLQESVIQDSNDEDFGSVNETVLETEAWETKVDVTEMETIEVTEEETVSDYLEESVMNFEKRILRDSLGIDSVVTWLPEGWSYEVTSYTTICENYPIQSIISLASPDGTYGIIIQTPMGYIEAMEYPTEITEGMHTPDDQSHEILAYCTYLHARDAAGYIDYFLNEFGWKFDGFYDMPIDHEAEEKLFNETNDYMYYQLDILNAAVKQETASLSMSVDLYPAGIESSISIKRGPIVGGGFVEARCVANQYTFRQDLNLNDNLIGLSITSDKTYWRQLGTVICWAQDEETFNENYEVCNFIINNTATTKMYQDAQQAILSEIIPKVVAGNTELINYAGDTINSVISDYSSTNDRVAQMWDDYILEQDRYSLPNGTEVVVPYTANYVYADDNGNIKWSEYADYDPGAGYTQIN